MNNSNSHNIVSDELCQAFESLFKGREDAWGGVEGVCHHEQVTTDHYLKHLLGETSLGIYPLLDNGTCHFVAVDLDIKDFTLAKEIRDELIGNNIPAYIAASKSKGFHIFSFAYEVFNAKEIRRVIHYILNKLNIKAEVFPKQDKVDKVIPYGNYINLPCFGYTRPFLTGDSKEVPLEIVIERIKYVPQEAIERLLKTIPKELPPKEKKTRERPRKHPPCIETILKGVSEPGRDVAAFALARYYIDELKYLPDDVLGILQEWDKRNKPPLGDERLLEIKVRSAEKGYKFGCKSINDNPNLSKFCVGVEECEWLIEVREKAEKRNRYLITDKKGKVIVDIKQLANDLMKEYTFKTYKDTEEILIYDSGRYVKYGEQVIKEECQARVGIPLMTIHKRNEVVAAIQDSTHILRSDFNQRKDLINLKNGLLNWKTGEFIEGHSPNYLSTIQLPVTYDPNAKCPVIEKFLSEVVDNENINLIYELFGNCLTNDNRMQKAGLFIGEGGGGKSTALNLLRALLGTENCSTQSLLALEYSRFATANLEGKLANIFADLPPGKMERSSIFKMLTGGDSIPAEEKFRQPHSFVNYAKLLFSTNRPPIVEDDTYAFWRRWVKVDFPHKFEGANEDKEILRKLTMPEELSGLFKQALDGLKRLHKEGRFSYTETPDEFANKYKKAADPIWAFVEECCELNPDAWISHNELHTAYLEYCAKENIPTMGSETFGKKMRDVKDAPIYARQHRDGGPPIRGWSGITLKEKVEIDYDV